MHVFIGLCSNLGDKEMNLVTAKDLLMKQDVLVMGQSTILSTSPLGGLDQPMYLNQVVECQTNLSPEDLLKACKIVEAEMGRPVKMPGVLSIGAKKEERWESRIIDVDILYYGDRVVKTADLLIPHYGAAERDFVVAGMVELAPDFVHPVNGVAMKDL